MKRLHRAIILVVMLLVATVALLSHESRSARTNGPDDMVRRRTTQAQATAT